MSRKTGFLEIAIRASRAAKRERAAAERHRATLLARAERERVHQLRQAAALDKQLQREAEREYVRQQQRETESLNADLEKRVEELTKLLELGLTSCNAIDFEKLKREPKSSPFEAGKLAILEAAPSLGQYEPPPLTGLRKFLPGAKRRHSEAMALARCRYEEEMQKHAAREAEREKTLADARSAHEQQLDMLTQEANKWNEQVNQFAKGYAEGTAIAVADYCGLVLDSSEYPEGFPKRAKTVYVADSKQLVVEYECPAIDLVPDVDDYKYVKSKDEIVSTQRSSPQRRSLYTSVIAQVTLRSLHELFEADILKHFDSIVFNGHVSSIDKGTGREVHPCIVTVRTTRDVFAGVNLARVDPQACLKTLGASVSPSPSEMVPVRPVLEFSMVDRRFVQELEVLSTLDQRPNLMELSPMEFESLISNLFKKMGLETRVTQASRDGGVDCVAYDPRPILGGKVIIQAKRYKNTVGVSAVRDLFGTLQNEGASKGILVTTSGYGKAAFEFAEGKPLELLSGSHLLYLLELHAGMKAKIEVPETWKDPIPDTVETEGRLP